MEFVGRRIVADDRDEAAGHVTVSADAVIGAMQNIETGIAGL